MSNDTAPHDGPLAVKIARLAQERGWNQEDFARISNLNRHTVRQILQQREIRRLRNATVMACAGPGPDGERTAHSPAGAFIAAHAWRSARDRRR